LNRRQGGLQGQSGGNEVKILVPVGNQNSNPLVIYPIVSHYTNYAVLALSDHEMEKQEKDI
jgi:hypothetical protein